MRIIRFLADDGRVLYGQDHGDGTATALIDAQGVLGRSAGDVLAGRLRGMNAIVADDDENMRELLTTVLRKAGCECTTCADGAEAMKAIRGSAPDIVVSDIQMPHYNGYEIFSAARDMRADMPILLITGFGYDPNHSLVKAAQEGLHAVLYKPFTPHELLEELGKAICFSNGALWKTMRTTVERLEVSKLLAPLEPTDVICIGRNYPPGPPATARGAGGEPVAEDLEVFIKPTSSILADGEPIRIPPMETGDPQVDGEAELAVVIGTAARDVSEADALRYVLGYTIANDVTARLWQTAEGPSRWMRGKGFDTFCPLGPAIVTADEITNPDDLQVRTLINGKTVRSGSTREMLRSVPRLIHELSRNVTLTAGSVVLTGAPARDPEAGATHLEPGDEVCAEIEGIGRLVNPVEAS